MAYHLPLWVFFICLACPCSHSHNGDLSPVFVDHKMHSVFSTTVPRSSEGLSWGSGNFIWLPSSIVESWITIESVSSAVSLLKRGQTQIPPPMTSPTFEHGSLSITSGSECHLKPYDRYGDGAGESERETQEQGMREMFSVAKASVTALRKLLPRAISQGPML